MSEREPVIVVATDACYPIEYHARGWLDRAAGTLEIVYPFADPSGEITPWSRNAAPDDGAIDLGHLLLADGAEMPLDGLNIIGQPGKSYVATWGPGYTKAGTKHVSPLFFTESNGYGADDVAMIDVLAIDDSAVLDAGGHIVTRLPDYRPAG